MVKSEHLGIGSRLLAAGPGGFALANAAAALGAETLPLSAAEAVTWATMAAFPIHLAAIIWAFAARSAAWAWAGIVIPALVCLLILSATA